MGVVLSSPNERSLARGRVQGAEEKPLTAKVAKDAKKNGGNRKPETGN